MIEKLGPSIKLILRCGLVVAMFAKVDVVAANGLSVLYAFRNGSDGARPGAGLVVDSHGNFYGTTISGGGAGCSSSGGCGTVFKLSPDGTETVLHAFQGPPDGELPYSALIADKKGNLYGTTYDGGSPTACNSSSGCGTVFKVTPSGQESVLYSFRGASDGAFPFSGLVEDSQGNFYGTTQYGGGIGCNADGCGTVFKIAPNGTETVLHAFQDQPDGADPLGAPLADSAGNLYGTTADGGTAGLGIVFELAPDGTEKVLYDFQGGSDGAYPYAGVVVDSQGNFFGTTKGGGDTPCSDFQGCGTVFRLAPDGTETVLHAFQGHPDGEVPWSALIADRKGNLYGTTVLGGTDTGCGNDGGGGGCGTVFELTSGGQEKVLISFGCKTDGCEPLGALIADKKGALFGTTLTKGPVACAGKKRARGCGTVFEVTK